MIARDEAWNTLAEEPPWDVLVVGGGITGAGILREAVRRGYRTALLERRDFAWGTSSRSSKLVHGGLRYLKEGRVSLTRESVVERERLLKEGPGLVEPLPFVLPSYRGLVERLTYAAGLAIYDVLAGRFSHESLDFEGVTRKAPLLEKHGLGGGFLYQDAQTDDARLVLRVLFDATRAGGLALNYAPVEGLLKTKKIVAGVVVRDAVSGRTAEVRSRVVINATGVFVDELRGRVGAKPRMRPLRGSHLVFSAERFPIGAAVNVLHPGDHRPLFAFPWEGATVFGTTDVDHRDPVEDEPAMGGAECAYLFEALAVRFPSLELSRKDVLATYSGVRPVIGTGKADPSKESRDHALWDESGLLTVAGGKLTTFGQIAEDALHRVAHRLPQGRRVRVSRLDPADIPTSVETLAPAQVRRVFGRYGAEAPALLAVAKPGELSEIPGTRVLWAELRWAARSEGVVHLEDLLLRRVRLGILARDGGKKHLGRIRGICQRELAWSDAAWSAEEAAYLALCRENYGLPGLPEEA